MGCAVSTVGGPVTTHPPAPQPQPVARTYMCIGNNGNSPLWGNHSDVIFRVKHSNKALDNASDKAIQWTVHGNANQRWHLQQVPNEPNYYHIVSKSNGKLLDVQGAGGQGAHVLLWQNNGQHNQQWTFTPRGNGYYSIHARHNGLALDINGQSRDDNAPAIVWPYSGGDNQLWKLEADSQQTGGYTPSITSPVFNIMLTAKHSGKNIDNASDKAVQWAAHGNPNQRWNLLPVEGAPQFYYVVSQSNQKNLDVEGAGGQGAKLLLWQKNGQQNQQFQFTPRGNGYYSIHARHNGLALDINGESKDDGAGIILYSFHGHDNQLFRIAA